MPTFSQAFWVFLLTSTEFLSLFWSHMNLLWLMSVWNWTLWTVLICKWSRPCSRSPSRLDAEVPAHHSVFVLLCEAKGTELRLKKWCQHHFVCNRKLWALWFWSWQTLAPTHKPPIISTLVSVHAAPQLQSNLHHYIFNLKKIELTWQIDLFEMPLRQYLIPVPSSGSRINKTM